MIEIKNLYLNYIKEYSALYNINLKIEDKEKVAIVGEDESGKTSLIRCLCKLENYNKGEIYINNINLRKIDFKKDVNLIYLSGNPVFLNGKTVYQNLAYSLKIRNFTNSQINQKINRALDYLGIESLKERKIKSLSNNEKQIVNIARSILREADYYLIDDIFNFDKETNEKIAKVFAEIFNKEATIIYVLNTKNIDLTKVLNTTRIIQMNNGSIEKDINN